MSEIVAERAGLDATLTTQRFDGVGLSLQFQYDAHGNRTQLTHPGAQKFSYAYDALDRLSGVYEGAGTAVPLATFTYNNRGLPDTRSERYGSAVAYSYDVIGRLKTLGDTFAGTAGDVTTTFGYNPASQLATKSRSNDAYAWTGVAGSENVERSYAVNGLNQYKDAGGPAFSYDANGNLKSDGTTTFGYDIENRLVTATGAKTATLRYDPVGRLYEVVSGTTTDRFLYDGDALVAEYDGTGNLTDRYVHGADAGADDPLVWYPTGQPAKFLHRDHQGSIVALATGPDGALAAINAYDEYGIPKAGNIVATGTGNTGRFQYTGQIWLGELGLYHYKARAYSPPLGRFLQTDPVGYDGGMNIYAYVGNDPVNGIDPTGNEQCMGSSDNCKIVAAGGQQLRETAAKTKEGSELRQRADSFGPPGKGTIVIADPQRPGQAVFDETKEAQSGGVIVIGKTALGESPELLGGTLGHEETHKDDHAANGTLKSGAERMDTERHAYRVENEYRSAKGWQPRDVEKDARTSFRVACTGHENEASCEVLGRTRCWRSTRGRGRATVVTSWRTSAGRSWRWHWRGAG